MRKLAAGSLAGLIALAVWPAAAPAPTFDRITPSKGKVGDTAVIHGSDLSGSPVSVKFGQASATDVQTIGDQTVKVKIPLKHALDPNTVTVTVEVGGQEAGTSLFTYDPPGQAPQIGAIDPQTAPPDTPFDVRFSGSNFTSPADRRPASVYAVGPEVVAGQIVTETITDESFGARFSGISMPGDYTFIVGFSDGSGAESPRFAVML